MSGLKDFYTNNIAKIVKTLNYNLDCMSDLESQIFRKHIFEKFTQGSENFPIWENIEPSFSIRDKYAWKWLDEFIRKEETYLFFDKDDDPIVYILMEGQSVAEFIAELPIYVFYITNKNLDYIVSHNDSDYLIASGTAEYWLREKVREMTANGWKDYNQILREMREGKRE